MGLTEDLNILRGRWDTAEAYWKLIDTHTALAYADYQVNNDHAAILHLINALYSSSTSIKFVLAKFVPFSPDYTLTYILKTYMGGGGGATMDDILNEMLSATFEQLTKFMGITQAYKVAVWDAPFNEEYYAALARGFKTWGM